MDKSTARKIARSAVGDIGQRDEFGRWSAEGVKSPELFYTRVEDGGTTKHAPRSWIFPIENRGEDVGYINVSARQTERAVLGYGGSEAPQRKLTEAKRKTPASSKSLTGRFLYRGGVEFLVESTDVGAVDLRSGRPNRAGPVADIASLMPTEDGASSSDKDQEDDEDWSGSTDDEVSGVPNWTEQDGGGADETDIGTGRDSWDEWDGCIPVAASIVLGYHEGLDDTDDEDREALIDRLHIQMGTGEGDLCDICTYWKDIPPGIEDYSHGSNSYNANNVHSGFKGNVKSAISNDDPCMLNMENGPYTDKGEGHSVCVVGYREESCGTFCSNMYYKVYNTYATSPDLVTHGSWGDACVTEVTVQ
ncbi:C39 family peptidase [Halorussus salilacus]|uniref:C39 family peptidase n=1 Tax=Halorussus salilacus TaxID=2953750 RepID=UPI0020A0291A|nr:C39 family peptidase [Halorussus salilacus]USZ67059.1 C39 family peptidase [Halorussus salilacus]